MNPSCSCPLDPDLTSTACRWAGKGQILWGKFWLFHSFKYFKYLRIFLFFRTIPYASMNIFNHFWLLKHPKKWKFSPMPYSVGALTTSSWECHVYTVGAGDDVVTSDCGAPYRNIRALSVAPVQRTSSPCPPTLWPVDCGRNWITSSTVDSVWARPPPPLRKVSVRQQTANYIDLQMRPKQKSGFRWLKSNEILSSVSAL